MHALWKSFKIDAYEEEKRQITSLWFMSFYIYDLNRLLLLDYEFMWNE